MAYFPKIGPFYDPQHEQQFYGEADGRLRLRKSVDSQLHSSRNITEDDGWNHVVQDHENMFYTEPVENNTHVHKISSISVNHRRQESYQSVGSVGSYHSGSSESPRQQSSRQNSMRSDHIGSDHLGSDHSGHSQGGIGRHYLQAKDRTLPDLQRLENFQRDNTLRQSDPSYLTFSHNLNSENGPPKTSQRLPLKLQQSNSLSHSNSSGLTVSQSGKRKSVNMVPNLKSVDDIPNLSGVTLCEKLYGIKLCHYKQKPPRPNGANMDMVLRDRKVIVQGVIPDSQADICGQINRGDMLVAMNDVDLTWLSIDDLLRQSSQQSKVKLTFQVPVVVGPKQATPPLTPTRNTPPLNRRSPPPIPPHIPLRIPLTPPPRPPVPQTWEQKKSLVSMVTGESQTSLEKVLTQWLFAVMYLTLSGQSENSKDDVVYMYPCDENKVTDIRGLYLTLSGLLPDVTSNQPKLTTVNYRGHNTHVAYWKHQNDVLLLCLPENRVPSFYLLHVFSDLLRVIQMLYGSVVRVFCDRELHNELDQLIGLTMYRILHSGVHTQSIPYCNPLEPILLDTLTGVRWLRLNQDDIVSCDEILSEFEAQDFAELEEVDPDERRTFGVLGSCLFYRDYLLCSHMPGEDLQDVHLFLKYHCILHLVSKQPVDDIEIWQEIYPTRLCRIDKGDKPGYREPKGRWFLLVVSMRHFLLCTILEAGSYSKVAIGTQTIDRLFVEQCKGTLAQLDQDDTDMELQCNERLFSEQTGPTLKCIDDEKKAGDIMSPMKSASPRINMEDGDKSVTSPNGPSGMKRQGSRLSYGSNESSGSSTSINKLKSVGKKGSPYEMDIVNRSFSRDYNRSHCDIKLTRSIHNQLFYYVNFNSFGGICINPTPFDLATIQGSSHQHLLFNFYGCCMRLHAYFESQVKKKVYIEDKPSGFTMEEGVMFTCQLPVTSQAKKHPTVIMYWVIGRRFADGNEMFVCLEDGAPQCLLELAFTYNFGLT